MPSLAGLSELMVPRFRVTCACNCLCALRVNRYAEPCWLCRKGEHATFAPRTRTSK